MNLLIFSSSAPCSSSISFTRSAMVFRVFSTSETSLPCFFSMGISLFMRLRSAFRFSFSISSSLRRASQASISVKSTSYSRFFRASLTYSGLERIRLMSSMALPPKKIRPCQSCRDDVSRGTTRFRTHSRSFERCIGRTRAAPRGPLRNGTPFRRPRLHPPRALFTGDFREIFLHCYGLLY